MRKWQSQGSREAKNPSEFFGPTEQCVDNSDCIEDIVDWMFVSPSPKIHILKPESPEWYGL